MSEVEAEKPTIEWVTYLPDVIDHLANGWIIRYVSGIGAELHLRNEKDEVIQFKRMLMAQFAKFKEENVIVKIKKNPIKVNGREAYYYKVKNIKALEKFLVEWKLEKL